LLFLLFFHFFEKSVFCATELFGFVLLKGWDEIIKERKKKVQQQIIKWSYILYMMKKNFLVKYFLANSYYCRYKSIFYHKYILLLSTTDNNSKLLCCCTDFELIFHSTVAYWNKMLLSSLLSDVHTSDQWWNLQLSMDFQLTSVFKCNSKFLLWI
jgi:hypothetical protein